MKLVWEKSLAAAGMIWSLASGVAASPDPELVKRHEAEILKWKAERDLRVLEPCSRDQLLAETTKPAELRGRLRHKQWSKTEESYAAGGSDYFVIYIDSEFSGREFPRALDAAVRKQLIALDGCYVRLKGRWAPQVRYSEQETKKMAEVWSQSQRPVGDDTPPATWGGDLIADGAEEMKSPTAVDKPDPREMNAYVRESWSNSAVRPARVNGVLQVAKPAADGESTMEVVPTMGLPIPLRADKYGDLTRFANLAGKTVEVRGRWARFITLVPDESAVKRYGPVIKTAEGDPTLAFMGGGIFVESISEVKDPEPSQK